MNGRADWDTIVIGAGPAGVIAARQLVLAGRRVLLVDQKKFPRTKVCGGCVGARALNILSSLGLRDRIELTGGPKLRTFELYSQARQYRWKLPGGYAVSRLRLDVELVHAAIEVGVDFRDGTHAEVRSMNGGYREVKLNDNEFASAKIVLVADGLARSSLSRIPNFKRRIDPASRIGVGAITDLCPQIIEPGTIHMALGRAGYVGFVAVEEGRINAAAAIAHRSITDHGDVASVIASILADARISLGIDLRNLNWIGTPALSHGGTGVADERLLVVGDSAGYVEPFTGEGIGWALQTGISAAAFANRVMDCWHSCHVREWKELLHATIGRRQSVCRAVTTLLRHPRLTNWMLRAATAFPIVSQQIVSRLP